MRGARRPRRARSEGRSSSGRTVRLLAGAALAVATVGAVGWWATDTGPEPSAEAFCARLAEAAAVLAGAVDRLAAGAQAQPLDPQAGIDEALAALQPDQEQISAASQAVGAWAEATCGLSLDGTRPVAGPAPPTTDAPGPDAPVAAPEGAATPS